MAGQKFPEVGLRAVFEITGFQKNYNQYTRLMRDIDKTTQQTTTRINQTTKGMANDVARSFSEFSRRSSIVQDAFDNLSPAGSIAEMQRMGEAFRELGNKAKVNVALFDKLVNSGLSFSQAMQVAGGAIKLDVEAFDRLIQRGVDAGEAFQRLTSGAGDAAQTVTILGRSFSTTAVAIGAVTAAFGASIALVKRSISEYTELAEATRVLRDQTGILSREASQYTQALTATGLSASMAGRSMTQFLNKVTDLNRAEKAGEDTSNDFATALDFLDVKITDTEGNLKPTEQLLNEVNEAFQRLGPGARTAEAAVSLFGIGAYRLLPLLTDQRVTLQDLIGTTQRYGSSLNALTQQEYADFVLAQFELRTALQGVFNYIGKNYIPILTQVERVAANIISIYRQLAEGTNNTAGAQKTLVGALTSLADWLEKVNDDVSGLIKAYEILLRISNPIKAAQDAYWQAVGRSAQSAVELADAEEKAAQAGFDLAQATADASVTLKEQMEALDELKSKLNEKLDDIDRDAAEKWDDILVKRARDAFDRSLQNVYKMDDLRRGLNEKLDDIERDFAKRWDDILVKRQREAFERSLREGWQNVDLTRGRDRQIADAIRDAAEQEREIRQEARKRIDDAEKDAQEKREELEREHLRRLADIRQDYLDTVLEAARQNDAVAVARAVRERDKATRKEQEKYAEEQLDLEESLAKKRQQIEEDRRQREEDHRKELARTLQRIQENYQRQVEELAIQRERERILREIQEQQELEDFNKAKAEQQQAAQEWYDKQLEEYERQKEREAQLRAIEFEREEIDFVKAWQRRIEEARMQYEQDRDALAEHLGMTGDMLEAAYIEWAQEAAAAVTEVVTAITDAWVNEIGRYQQYLTESQRIYSRSAGLGTILPGSAGALMKPPARAPQQPFGFGPGMAEGGVLQVSKPTMVTMGEAGPETGVFLPGRSSNLNVQHNFGRLGVDFQGLPGGMNTQQVQQIVYAVVTQLAKGVQVTR